jgi:hypothetical protein
MAPPNFGEPNAEVNCASKHDKFFISILVRTFVLNL